MSLRRPCRDSWEQREHDKLLARSCSPPPKEQAKRTAVPSSMPKALQTAVIYTTTVDPGRSKRRRNLQPTVESDSDSDSNASDHLSKPLAPEPRVGSHVSDSPAGSVHRVDPEAKKAANSRHVHFMSKDTFRESSCEPIHTRLPISQAPESESSDSPVRPSEVSVAAVSPSTLPPKSTLSTHLQDLSVLSANAADQTEKDMLHAEGFPTRFTRPVPTMIELMSQIAPVLGDPGAVPIGKKFFSPKSPAQPLFEDPEVSKRMRWEKPEVESKQSILDEKSIKNTRKDDLVWEKRPPMTQRDPKVSSEWSETAVGLVNSQRGWQGRKYSVNPNLKTRHLEFDVYQRKIPHYELLELDLSLDARRDAITIGGGGGDVNSSTSLAKSIRHSRGRIQRLSSISTVTLPSTRSSTFPSARPSSRNRPNNTAMTVSQKSFRSDVGEDWDNKHRRWRAQGIDEASNTGRYATGGVMLWRLVRVMTRIEENNSVQEPCAWYVLPDRDLGGWF